MKSAVVLAAFAALVSSLPIRLPTPMKREVPQEHSHEQFLTSVRASLAKNNPLQVEDPVFALLGDAAAAGGAGQVTNLDCLQMFVADQAFTNAKADSDVSGMVDALIFRALERNTGAVGTASVACTETATNPEIAAISQHQDPASTGAAAINKAIVLELAKQIASVGGTATDALKSGTFAPGTIGDPTAAGHTCDETNDPVGCIFTQNLLVDDATTAEIAAAVAGISSTTTNTTSTDDGTTGAGANVADPVGSTSTSSGTGTACSTVTVTMTMTLSDSPTQTPSSSVASPTTTSAPAATTTSAPASTTTTTTDTNATAGNLQQFTGTLGGSLAPAVTAGGSKGFVVEGSDFIQLAGALGRSCDEQHNTCADAANAGGNSAFTVSQCDDQNTQCHALITSESA